MTKITYLLGAGASANALPINKHRDDGKIGSFDDELKIFRNFLALKKNLDRTLLDQIDQILPICAEMGTPDLGAKFLLETNQTEKYKFWVRFLSNYFTFKQQSQFISPDIFNGNNKGETRALTFLTTISKDRKIPDNVKLISWNYDSQIEFAARKLMLLASTQQAKIQNFTSWPNTIDGETCNYKKTTPFLIHINGVAGFDYSANGFIEKHDNFLDFETNLEPLLSFAWEDENNVGKPTFTKNRLSIAERSVYKTEILVVIGYTFPFFNRNFDKRLFLKMKKSLQKIYVQDPYYNGSQLRKQFDITRSAEIVRVTELDNYFVPYEL